MLDPSVKDFHGNVPFNLLVIMLYCDFIVDTACITNIAFHASKHV